MADIQQAREYIQRAHDALLNRFGTSSEPILMLRNALACLPEPKPTPPVEAEPTPVKRATGKGRRKGATKA